MVVPNAHVAKMEALDNDTAAALMITSKACIRSLKEVYGPEGYNLGMNLGVSGGAGIKNHLHLHIIPRWLGDTNFLPILADTKAMPQHLLKSFDDLKVTFDKSKKERRSKWKG